MNPGRDYSDAASVRRRALVFAAALAPLPLRRELETIVAPGARDLAADAVSELLRDGLLELVEFRSGVRIRLTLRGRDQLLGLPGGEEPRPGAGGPGGSPVACLAEAESGQTTTEYAILLGFLAIATVVAVGFLQSALLGLFSDAAASIAQSPEVCSAPALDEFGAPILDEFGNPVMVAIECPVEPEPTP